MEELSLEGAAAAIRRPGDILELNIINTTNETFEGDTHTVYHLEVKNATSGVTTVLKKRFSQFDELHNLLVKHFSGFWRESNLPSFPAKTLIRAKLDAEVIFQRKTSLLKWLRAIQQLPNVWSCFFVQLWLEQAQFDDKNVVITGANSGFGFETASILAKMGARVILACRSEEKAIDAMRRIQDSTEKKLELSFMHLDLADIDSIQKFADNYIKQGLNLHLLILNAGCMGVESLTKDGFEMQFGVNYLSNFILVKLLLDVMKQSKPARIVTLVPENGSMGDSIDYTSVCTPTQLSTIYSAYNYSKLALNTWTVELSRRLRGSGVTVNCVFPGYCGTNLFRELGDVVGWLFKNLSSDLHEAGRVITYVACSPELDDLSGLFIGANGREEQHARFALKEENGATLWAMSEAWIYGVVNNYKVEQNK